MMCFWTLRKEWTLNSVISANSGYKKTEDAVIWLADVERHSAMFVKVYMDLVIAKIKEIGEFYLNFLVFNK